MSASVIFPAIKTKFEAVAGLSALGTLYEGMQPETAAFPYARFFLLPGPKPVVGFGTKYMQTYRIQFDLFGTSDTVLAGYQDVLHTNFDRAAITYSSGTGLSCIRTMDWFRRDPAISKDGQPIYHAGSYYELTLDKSY